MNIAITTSSFAKFDQSPLKLFQERNINYTLNPYARKLTEEEAIEIYKGCIGVISGTEPITQKVMQNSPDLRVISRCGIGLGNVDLQAAKNLNIQICSTPDAPTQATAEHTLGLILNLFRKISTMDQDMRNGIWKKRMGSLLQGKKIGIIGFGRVGKGLFKLLKAFDCEICYYDPYIAHQEDFPTRLNLDQLLAWAQIVTLHCDHINQTDPLLNAQSFKQMRQGSFLINTARGELVHEQSLLQALTSKHLAGAALDVYAVEPYAGKLSNLDNVLLTPHAASYALESRIQMELQAVNNLIAALDTL